MSDLDDLEGITDLFKREAPRSGARGRKARSNALASIEKQKVRQRGALARLNNSARHRRAPITLAPIGGSK